MGSESKKVVYRDAAGTELWSLTARLGDYPNGALSLHHVHYRGTKVLHKASAPYIRVKYANTSYGVFDWMDHHNARPWRTGANAPRIRVHTVKALSGKQWLAVSTYHQNSRNLGDYHINQEWLFMPEGAIVPRMWSAGERTPSDHTHHVYWRLDFDIDTPADHRVYHRGKELLTEQAGTKDASVSLDYWRVKNQQSGRSCYIFPGSRDGTSDAFSSKDYWAMQYATAEDRSAGRTGGEAAETYTVRDANLFAMLSGQKGRKPQPLRDQDVVFWYVAHLFHKHQQGHHKHIEFQGCGPTLILGGPGWPFP